MNFPFYVLIAKQKEEEEGILAYRRFHSISCSIFFFLSIPPSPWNRDQNPPHRQRMSVSTVEEGWVPRVRIAIVTIRVQYTLAFTCVCIRAHGTQGTRLEGRLNDPPLAEQTGGWPLGRREPKGLDYRRDESLCPCEGTTESSKRSLWNLIRVYRKRSRQPWRLFTFLPACCVVII